MERLSTNDIDVRPAGSWPRHSGLPLSASAIGVAYLLASVFAIRSTHAAAGPPLLWPGDAIAAALLVRFPRVGFAASAAAIFLAALAAALFAAGESLPIALSSACVDVATTCLMAWAFRGRKAFPVPDISVLQAAQMTVIFGLAIPALSAIPGGFMLHRALGAPLARASLDWWLSSAIGACLFGPPIILYSAERAARLATHPLRNCALALICLGCCYFAIREMRYPFVAICVPLMAAAFRLGGFGAATLSLLCGLEMFAIWIFGVSATGTDLYRRGIAVDALPIVTIIATLMPPIAIGLGTDERRSRIRELRVSERRFRESLARSPIGNAIIDLDGYWKITNDAAQQMLGYSAAEFPTLTVAALTDPADHAEISRRWQMLRAGEIEYYDTERRFLQKSGAWIWARAVVSIVRDEDRLPLHYIAHLESVDARRRAERELALEQERIRTTLRSIADAVITSDANGRIKYVNDAAQAILGQSLADIHGRAFNEVTVMTDPATSLESADLLAQCVSEKRIVRSERAGVLHRPDASVCYVTLAVTPVVDADGAVSGTVIVLRDVSGEYEREREIGHRATHDVLTGLANRFEFQRRAKIAFQHARTLAYPAAMIAIDLDRFKAVNDGGGHAAGDAILRKVAELLKSAIRSSDAVARLGGDEFAIILENCGPVRSAALVKKILRSLNPLETDWDGTTYIIGASLGVAMLDADCADEAAWLAAADRACYEAKRDGRGQMRVA